MNGGDRARASRVYNPPLRRIVPPPPSRKSTLARPKWFRPDDGAFEIRKCQHAFGRGTIICCRRLMKYVQRLDETVTPPHSAALMSVKMSRTFFASQFVLIEKCEEARCLAGRDKDEVLINILWGDVGRAVMAPALGYFSKIIPYVRLVEMLLSLNFPAK